MCNKLSKFSIILSAIFLTFALTSCASIFKGTNQELTFDSSPKGAMVYLDGKMMGNTPVTISLKKNKYSNVRFELEGYQTVSRDLNKKYDPVSLLNVFWDYSTTDLLTGAAFPYAENAYYVELQKLKQE